MPLSRRALLGLSAASLALPRRLLAASEGSGRKFLFVFCPGGWDPTYVFAPLWDVSGVDMPPDDSVPATIGGFSLVDSGARPSVRRCFENWGSRSALVHGVYVPSVSHDVCRRLVLTGSSQGLRDGWDVHIAAAAGETVPMPLVHLSGPMFAPMRADAVVRMGERGQFAALLQGVALGESDMPVRVPSDTVQALERAFLTARASEAAAAAGLGWADRQAAAQLLARQRFDAMLSHADGLTISEEDGLSQLGSVIGELFESNLARCAMIAYEGPAGQGWDTHTENTKQSLNFEGLFGGLDDILTDLSTRTGSAGSLLDETTVVVLSEMGRDPRLNGAAGKDHWPWTSALLIGGGIRGGTTVGGWTDGVGGQPVDLATGEGTDTGVTITTEVLGATLLALADVDPGEVLDAPTPLIAVLS